MCGFPWPRKSPWCSTCSAGAGRCAGERFRWRSPAGIRVTVSSLPVDDADRLAADIAAAFTPGGPLAWHEGAAAVTGTGRPRDAQRAAATGARPQDGPRLSNDGGSDLLGIFTLSRMQHAVDAQLGSGACARAGKQRCAGRGEHLVVDDGAVEVRMGADQHRVADHHRMGGTSPN